MAEYDTYMEACRLSVLSVSVIESAMGEQGVTREQLAVRLNRPVAEVESVLDGETDMTLALLAEFGLALGVRWAIRKARN